MTESRSIAKVRSHVWTLELLAEALVHNDGAVESEQPVTLSHRHRAGIHQAIKIISQLAAEQCGKLIGPTHSI